MKSIILFILFSSSFSAVFAQNIMSLKGEYSLFVEDGTNSNMVVRKMRITPFENNRFVVRGEDWVGMGVLNENKGYYDWRFDDGKTGQTTFVLNADGSISGRVLGYNDNPSQNGLDWRYRAKKINNQSTAFN